jgi:hypothetical protein
MRIAMWSGPRNISTAMMRSWGNRPDTFVCDEPLYAHYLRNTDVEHPGRDEVIASQENDWRKVVAWLTGPAPQGRAIFYQKHMTHHLLPEIDRNWLGAVTNCFLIRDPREMITSLLKFLPSPNLRDTGLPQQVEIFDWVRRHTGSVPPVVDSKDVLLQPRRMLGLLCEAIGVAFTEAMLSWLVRRRRKDHHVRSVLAEDRGRTAGAEGTLRRMREAVRVPAPAPTATVGGSKDACCNSSTKRTAT